MIFKALLRSYGFELAVTGLRAMIEVKGLLSSLEIGLSFPLSSPEHVFPEIDVLVLPQFGYTP